MTGTQQVRYGANGTFLYRTATDSIACTNAAFGSDPVPWIVKRCEVGPSPAVTDAPWSASGTGASVTSDGTSGDPVLDYSVNGSSGAWKFSATATFERQQPVTWRYKGYHAWYQVRVAVEKFVIRNGTEIITETLRSAGPVNCCASPSGGFDYTGTTTFDLQAGDVYGFRISGSHFDSDRRLIGTLSLSIPVALPTPVQTTLARIQTRNEQLDNLADQFLAANAADDTPEDELAELLAGINSGLELSNTDMLQLQFQMSQFTLTATIVSSIVKDLADTMRSIAAKIG